MTIAEARELFVAHRAPTSTRRPTGCRRAPVRERLAEVLGEWRDGTGDWVEWSGAAERARATFARLVGVGPGDVAIGATVSELVGLVAASLPDGAKVLTAEGDFSSVPMPFAIHRRPRRPGRAPCRSSGWSTRSTRTTTLVAVSAVQSAGGAVCDLARPGRGGRRPRRAGAGRRLPGLRLAADRREPDRLPGVRRLQVAALAARHGLPDGARAAGSTRSPRWPPAGSAAQDPYASFYYRGDGPRAGPRRAPARLLTGLVRVGRRRARARG